jgi:hypothetical protein
MLGLNKGLHLLKIQSDLPSGGAEFVGRHQKDWVHQFDSARSTLRILLEQLSWSKKQTKVPKSQ